MKKITTTMNVLPKNTIGPGEHYFTNPSSENLIKLRHFAKVVHQRRLKTQQNF